MSSGNWGWGEDELIRPMLETQIPVNLEPGGKRQGGVGRKQEGPGGAKDAGHLPSLLASLAWALGWRLGPVDGWPRVGVEGQDPVCGGRAAGDVPGACCRWGQQGGPLPYSMLLRSRDVEGCVMKNLHPLHRRGLASS